MKTKAFQTKRKPKKDFRTLFAKTRKRKQRVSAAASGGDYTGEEPNLGVARALVVILILHIAAIIAIVVHSSRNDDPVFTKSPEDNSVDHVRTTHAEKPKIGGDDNVEYVQKGDTYERFARRHQVNVQELRRLNNNTPLLYNMPLIMPSVPVAVAQNDEIINETLPPIVELPAEQGLPAGYEVVENVQPVEVSPNPFPEAAPLPPQPVVQIRPTTVARDLYEVEPLPVVESVPVVESKPVAEPQAVIVPEPVVAAVPEQKKPEPAPKAKLKSYKIRKGDTLWAVSKRHGISVEKLLSANPNVNPRKMKPGIRVNIPTR